MAKRERVRAVTVPSNYFVAPKPGLKFVGTGCTVLDCVLGGGWTLGRIGNVVGDRSTAKTALATEALINFRRAYPKGQAAYRDIEAAFDGEYARAMGLPLDEIDFGDAEKPITTIEEFGREFDEFLNLQTKRQSPGIYVLDTLDALSDDAEMDRNLGDATYGMGKAKLLSEFFRTTARKIEKSQVLLLVISQVRENIGVTFGEKYKRSGGKSLGLYASQELWLAHIKTLKRTINKVERPYGVVIKAKCKKNKVGLPLRECDFEFIFGFGVEDVAASVQYLSDVHKLDEAGIDNVKAYWGKVDAFNDDEYRKEGERLAGIVKLAWADVETTFLPKRAKYG